MEVAGDREDARLVGRELDRLRLAPVHDLRDVVARDREAVLVRLGLHVVDELERDLRALLHHDRPGRPDLRALVLDVDDGLAQGGRLRGRRRAGERDQAGDSGERSHERPHACPPRLGCGAPLQPHSRRQRNVESPPRAAMIAGRMRREGTFRLRADFAPEGDQPQAIAALTEGVRARAPHQVLLGVTGSGKTFTVSHVIANLNPPTLVIAPNKTLAAQLYTEFRTLFPDNAVRYFVSYYDYYQPEAYVPSTDTYIEKDASINDEIDKMRHAATEALLERNDALVVASVSCIYGLGSPTSYFDML